MSYFQDIIKAENQQNHISYTAADFTFLTSVIDNMPLASYFSATLSGEDVRIFETCHQNYKAGGMNPSCN